MLEGCWKVNAHDGVVNMSGAIIIPILTFQCLPRFSSLFVKI